MAVPGEVSALARGQLALPIPDLRPKPNPKPDPTPKPPLRRGQAGGGPAAGSDRTVSAAVLQGWGTHLLQPLMQSRCWRSLFFFHTCIRANTM